MLTCANLRLRNGVEIANDKWAIHGGTLYDLARGYLIQGSFMWVTSISCGFRLAQARFGGFKSAKKKRLRCYQKSTFTVYNFGEELNLVDSYATRRQDTAHFLNRICW